MMGEIDCREGILIAVERDRYDSVEEGMKSTIDVFKNYLAASGSLAKKKKFQVCNF